jgi:hypothetical protein
MSVQFNYLNGQYLLNTAPAFTTYPFTIGLWATYVPVSSTRVVWALSKSGNNTTYFAIGVNTSGQWTLFAGDAVITLGSAIAGQWTFLLGRFISSANRRFSVLDYDGTVTHGQSTATKSPSPDRMVIGGFYGTAAANLWNGSVAEFWCANTDIQPDGAQLQDSLLRELAFGGPFALPGIAKDIVEYRSFRRGIASDQDAIGEVYFGGLGRQTWSNLGGATLGPHPPLPYWYRNPLDFIRSVPV